ncbi:MAG: methyl-accepting chemotaxis protein [Treponema sp.]|jgi:methyl-accepting chemotaxis protein|nr:methyl-accepting chemotaxis protein [Treponema sp.]
MSKESKKSIGRKLIIAGVLSTTFVAITLFAVTTWQNIRIENVAEQETDVLSSQVQDHIVEGVMSMLVTQQELLEDKMGHDLQTAGYLLAELGPVNLRNTTQQWEAKNQESGEVVTINLPVMMAGNTDFGQNKDIAVPTPLVDHVMEMNDCTSTIFQRMNDEGDMLRIATNVENLDGTRAIGTYIPAVGKAGNSEIIQVVLSGQKYVGRAFVVNKWYTSSYEPLFDNNNNVIGMLFVGLAEENSNTLRNQIYNTVVGDTGYVYVIDRNGNYVISPNGTEDGLCIMENKCADGNYYIQYTVDAALKLTNGKLAKVEYPLINPETNTRQMRTTTVGYFAPWDWIIVAGTWEPELQKSVYTIQAANSESQVRMVGILAASLTVIAAIWVLLSRGITKPIQLAGASIQKIGAGDFTQKLNIMSSDEIGHLAKDYNIAVENVQNLIKTIIDSTKGISSVSQTLNDDMGQTSTLVGKTRDSIHSIQNDMESQAASVVQTTATMKNITSSIANLNSHINEQSDKVSQSSSAIEEMLANISSVTRTLEANGDLMEELKDLSEKGRKDLGAVSSDIQTVASESEELMAISVIIEDIAQQTNLLSMNAAIEAAHAGESGKGFAVVADEIRKLAESSANEAKTISSELGKIKEAIDRMNVGSQAVIHQFENIDQRIRHVSEQEETIRSAMKEQEVGSQDILEAVESLSDISKKVESESEEMRNGSQEILTESSSLEKITSNVKNQIDNMAGNIEDITGTIKRVETMSKENQDNIDVLNKEIRQFKIA